MPVTVVVGGQKGDEGKGKISAYLVKRDDYDISIRISGPNAGHTMKIGGESLGLATLPCGFVNDRTRLLIGRGAYVDVERLLDEIDRAGISSSGRLGVDGFATIITPEHKSGERGDDRLMKNIGSVGTGLGRARVDKINRSENIIFAKDIPELSGYITDTTEEIFKSLEKGGKVLLEGDQGFSLSLIHGEFPYVTSRDTSASTFLGEAGIGPRSVEDVYIVFKPYVTRVAPGPLEKELETVSEWYHTDGGEVGTVSGRKRRIGEFEWDNAKRAVMINGANKICLTHIDVFGAIEDGKLPPAALEFVDQLKEKICSPYPSPELAMVSYGPGIEEILEF